MWFARVAHGCYRIEDYAVKMHMQVSMSVSHACGGWERYKGRDCSGEIKGWREGGRERENEKSRVCFEEKRRKRI